MNMIRKLFRKLFSKPEVMSFKQSFDLTELPVITLYQGEKKFNFLLDTGANNSIIDSNILEDIKHTKLNAVTQLFGLEGNAKENCVCKIDVYYKEKKYEGNFIIVDMTSAFLKIKQDTGVTLHGILGAKFFDKYKYVLDFNEMIAYSKA